MIPELEVQITADTSGAEAGLSRLQKAMNGLDQATEQYQRELRTVKNALASGLTTQEAASRAVQEAERSYREAAAEAAKYAGASTSFMRKGVSDVKALGSATQASSHHTANLAANFNDIGMMMASGQSPFLLALQQGTQVSQVLNQMGGRTQILKGLASGFMSVINPVSLLTLGVIAGGAALGQWAISALSAKDEAYDFGKEVDLLREITDGAKESMEILSMSVDELVKKYGNAARQTREFAAAQAELRAAQAEARLGDQLGMINSELERFTVRIRDGRGSSNDFRNTIDEISESMGVNRQQARVLEEQFYNLSEAGDFESQKEALAGVLQTMEDMEVPLKALPPELQLAIDEMITLTRETDAAKTAMDNLAAASRDVSTGVPLFLQGFSGQELLPPGPSQDGGGRSSRSGRRGPEGNPRLERLIEDLKTEREIVEEWRQEGMELLNQANEQELEALGGHAEAKLRLEQEYQERLNRIKEMGQKADLQTVLKGGSQILGALGAFNEDALKLSQAFAAAEAFVSTMKGAAKELEKGTFGFATAAAVIAKGLGFVAAIRGVGASSSGATGIGAAGGGAGGAAGAAQAAPQPQPVSREVAIRLEGGDNFSRGQVINLINGINEAVEDGAVVRLA